MRRLVPKFKSKVSDESE